ncbi:inositol-phosphate phosphatase [Actibacterium atlanticum]|uniref:Inositol-phosphate phosphatase n=1 Tax=Actibacterium atlanticum TaxID=1461693 RepID=A0A058ZM71_9RHOB|nr:3'(2'),5'-bisphosphate nucleotidase CysQ [Actibacterium atlanticum]KCV82277.1 inositol-phosphate phosphatase [Actibacterium atlanticum]
MPESDLPLLIDAAHEAGHIAAKHWRNSPRYWDKPDQQGPVTEADIEIDEMLRERLIAARPDYGWLSEESVDNPERLDTHRAFVVDPIDGTRAFMSGDRTFAHAIAVVERGQVIASLVFLPLRQKMYTATLGGGAELNGVQIGISERTELEGAELLIARPALDQKFWRGPVPVVNRHLRPSLAYRLCLVAEGRFDAMVTIRDSWDWDIAAGALILGEAGAVISDRSGAPLEFNTRHPASEGVVAGTPALHQQIISRLEP